MKTFSFLVIIVSLTHGILGTGNDTWTDIAKNTIEQVFENFGDVFKVVFNIELEKKVPENPVTATATSPPALPTITTTFAITKGTSTMQNTTMKLIESTTTMESSTIESIETTTIESIESTTREPTSIETSTTESNSIESTTMESTPLATTTEPPDCICKNVTIYSICNTDNNFEFGTYNYNGSDSDGYSKYQSLSNPTYKLYYDLTIMKWLAGSIGEDPVLNSAETTDICPSNNLTLSYINETQDCSISILCGSITLPSIISTNSSGDGKNIQNENHVPSTISAAPEDCLCTGYVKLSSTCLGATVQNYAMGEYEKVCVSENNTQVYQHTNSDINLYLYYEASLEKWLISSGIGGTSANIGISSLQSCAYEHSTLDQNWNFYDGYKFVEDCSMDLTCLEYEFQEIETIFQKKQIRTNGCNTRYQVTLDSIGEEYQSDVAGEYIEVCSVDGKPIFRNPSNDYYMYTWNDVYWFISRRIGDDSFLLAMITANSACPDDNSLFLVRTGPGQNDHSVTSKIIVTET